MIITHFLALVASTAMQLTAAASVPAVRAHANLVSFVVVGDYPSDALRLGQQGTTGFELDVAPDGTVAACRVTAPSGVAALDETTCRIMTERARFSSARDVHGNAVADRIQSRITWRIPAPQLPQVSDPTGPAGGNLASYVSNNDYPPQALANHEQGTVAFELIVGVNGRVRDCTVTASSGSASLDEATCRIMRERPRFQPARDATGNLVEDRVQSRLRWQMGPGAAAPPPTVRARARANLASYVAADDFPVDSRGHRPQGTVYFRLGVSPEGRVTWCQVMGSSGSGVLDRATCQIMIGRARFEPARDAEGHAVSDTVNSRIAWAYD